MIERIIEKLAFRGALLDRNGIIIAVSQGWRSFADQAGLGLESYGLGLNYLNYCNLPDPRSTEIVKGLSGVINRTLDCFSTLYPCGTTRDPNWFLLLAFPNREPDATTIVAHLDMSALLPEGCEPTAMMLSSGRLVDRPLHDVIETTIRKSIEDTLASTTPRFIDRHQAQFSDDQRKLARLTDTQMKILRHLSTGATNAEIAKALGISLNATKAQTAALVKKLGFDNRTKAALYAIRNGIGPS